MRTTSKQGRFLIDRAGEILDAAGSKRVQKVYAERVTGNCSHQHGTARMGDDPATSVLNRWCRAHEVDNLYAVDGSPFPTGTGANPDTDNHGQRLARRGEDLRKARKAKVAEQDGASVDCCVES